MVMLFKEKRDSLIALMFSTVFAFFNAYGRMIKNAGKLDFSDRIIVLVNTVIIALIAGEGYLRLKKWMIQKRAHAGGV